MKVTGIKETTATPTYSNSKNDWVCPNCKYKGNRPVLTWLKWATRFETCDRCNEDIKLTNPTPDK